MVFFDCWIFVLKILLFIGFDSLKSFPHFKHCIGFGKKNYAFLNDQ